jgi:hypothetical protein
MEIEDNQPQADANTKFEVRGFRPTEPDEESAQEEAPEEPLSGMLSDGQELSAEEADATAAGMQTQAEPVDNSVDNGDSEQSPEKNLQEAHRKEAKIKIGTREFDNQEDAWAYAQELEQEKIANDAFRHGIETASRAQKGNNPGEPQPEEDEDPNFETEFYTDPKGTLKKYAQRITEQVTRQVRQEAETKQKNEQTWTKFKSTYPDLAGPDEFADVQSFIFSPQNWNNLKHLDTEKALKIAADAVREKYSRILKSRMPGKELKTVKTPASPGNGINVTPQKREEPALNFVTQAKQWKAKRTAKPMRR